MPSATRVDLKGKIKMLNLQWKGHGRTLGVMLGALLVVTLIAVLSRDGATPLDPSELDGDPDGNSLERPLFFVASACALLLYGIVAAVVVRMLQRHRGISTDRAHVGVPRAAYFGAAPVLVYVIVVGDAGVSLGHLVPVALVIVGGLVWSVSSRRRASGLAWVGGVVIGAALGTYVVWLASIATAT